MSFAQSARCCWCTHRHGCLPPPESQTVSNTTTPPLRSVCLLASWSLSYYQPPAPLPYAGYQPDRVELICQHAEARLAALRPIVLHMNSQLASAIQCTNAGDGNYRPSLPAAPRTTIINPNMCYYWTHVDRRCCAKSIAFASLCRLRSLDGGLHLGLALLLGIAPAHSRIQLCCDLSSYHAHPVWIY